MDGKDMYNNSDQQPELVDSVTKSNMLDEETNGDILKQHQYLNLASQVGQGNSNNSSGTFGDGSEQMKIFVTNANVTYHTRHARRIYVGGIPPNYSDEEELRNFFNKVISKGLGVENDQSFVISVYMNQKKCYAFVEFNSIELTTACLEMDGIIFKKVTLKIYRANEYRPELVPATKFLKLDLTGWSFGLPTGAGANLSSNASNTAVAVPASYQRSSSAAGMNQQGAVAPGWGSEEHTPPVSLNDCIASLIQFINIASIEPGSVAIVGFPYEGGSGKTQLRGNQRGVGSSAAPSCLRKCLTSYPGAMIYNAELGLDLSLQPIMDVGDVLAGQSRNETKALLSTTVSELLLRGSVPFLVGGSRDQTYHSAMVSNFHRLSNLLVVLTLLHDFVTICTGFGSCHGRLCGRDERERAGGQPPAGLPGVLRPRGAGYPQQRLPDEKPELLRALRAVRSAGMAPCSARTEVGHQRSDGFYFTFIGRAVQ
jgi:hypothetical protein